MHVEEWHLVESHFESGIIVKPVFLGGIYVKISARRPQLKSTFTIPIRSSNHPANNANGSRRSTSYDSILPRRHGQQGDSRGNRLDPDQKAALVAGPAQQRQPTTSWVGPMVAALRSEREALTEEQLDRQE